MTLALGANAQSSTNYRNQNDYFAYDILNIPVIDKDGNLQPISEVGGDSSAPINSTGLFEYWH